MVCRRRPSSPTSSTSRSARWRRSSASSPTCCATGRPSSASIRPGKTRSQHRLYRRRDVETLLEIKRLLHNERYTIEGAKRRLKTLAQSRRPCRRGPAAAGFAARRAHLSQRAGSRAQGSASALRIAALKLARLSRPVSGPAVTRLARRPSFLYASGADLDPAVPDRWHIGCSAQGHAYRSITKAGVERAPEAEAAFTLLRVLITGQVLFCRGERVVAERRRGAGGCATGDPAGGAGAAAGATAWSVFDAAHGHRAAQRGDARGAQRSAASDAIDQRAAAERRRRFATARSLASAVAAGRPRRPAAGCSQTRSCHVAGEQALEERARAAGSSMARRRRIDDAEGQRLARAGLGDRRDDVGAAGAVDGDDVARQRIELRVRRTGIGAVRRHQDGRALGGVDQRLEQGRERASRRRGAPGGAARRSG